MYSPLDLVANAGTPLMWGGCGMLLFGNYAIGLFESWLIRRRIPLELRTPTPKIDRTDPANMYAPPRPFSEHPANAMITANYVSMLIGGAMVWAIQPLLQPVARDPFHWAIPTMVAVWIVSFVVTVFAEWPFVARTAKIPRDRKSLVMSLWVQASSYVILIAIAFGLGSISAVTDLQSVSPSQLHTVPGWVFYGAPDGRTVLRTRLDGSRTERVAECSITMKNGWARIYIQPTRNGDRARLMLHQGDTDTEIIKRVGDARQAAPIEFDERRQTAEIGNGTFGSGSTRAFTKSRKAYCDFWARIGLIVDGHRYAFETPFLALAWRCVVVLPDRKVVAQFGSNIVLLDPDTHQIAKLGEGSGGDVLID